ncbi:MAG: MFS transporter [Elusimicrobia bacterium]|nr:MFS transporter [Elusimicrobiota bacterium]
MRFPARGQHWPLLVSQCVLVSGLALSFPFFALYLHGVRGLPMSLVGAALCATLTITALTQVVGGELSDLLGSKPVMQAAVGAYALMAALMAWAMAREAPVWLLIAIHILAGFCGSFFNSAVRCWVAASCPVRERLVSYGRLRVAINLGWAVGPALGGVMAQKSYALLFAVASAACLACLALVHWTVANPPRLRAGSRFSWRETFSAASDRRFLRFCVLGFLISVVIAQLVVSLSVHSVRYVGLTEAQVGRLFTLNGILVVLAQSFISARLKGLSLCSGLAAGCLFYAAGYGWAGFAWSFPLMALAVAVVTLGELVVSPGLQALAANLAPEKYQGRYVGFHGLALQLGGACGPLFGGFALQALSPRWSPAPWLAVAALGVLAALGFHRFKRELRPGEDGLHEPALPGPELSPV